MVQVRIYQGCDVSPLLFRTTLTMQSAPSSTPHSENSILVTAATGDALHDQSDIERNRDSNRLSWSDLNNATYRYSFAPTWTGQLTPHNAEFASIYARISNRRKASVCSVESSGSSVSVQSTTGSTNSEVLNVADDSFMQPNSKSSGLSSPSLSCVQFCAPPVVNSTVSSVLTSTNEADATMWLAAASPSGSSPISLFSQKSRNNEVRPKLTHRRSSSVQPRTVTKNGVNRSSQATMTRSQSCNSWMSSPLVWNSNGGLSSPCSTQGMFGGLETRTRRLSSPVIRTLVSTPVLENSEDVLVPKNVSNEVTATSTGTPQGAATIHLSPPKSVLEVLGRSSSPASGQPSQD